MGIEENKETLKRLFDEVWNNNNLDAVNKCFAENFVRYGIGGTSIDLNTYKQFLVTMRKTTPDIYRSLDEMVAEGDKIAFSFTWTGTDIGGWGGRPPTGKKLSAEECYIARFENGKIVEIKQHADPMGLFQELGIIPTMAEIQTQKQKEKTEEENKNVIRRLVEEVYDKGDLSIIPELIDTDYCYVHPMGLEIKGIEGFSQFIQMLYGAFSDFHMVLQDMIAENDNVGINNALSGTLTGKFGEYEPTGNKVNLTESMFFTLKDGKVVEQKAYTDGLSFMQQAGINPFEQ